MPDEIEVSCPGCNVIFNIPPELMGEIAECSECGSVFEIPKVSLPEKQQNGTQCNTTDTDGIVKGKITEEAEGANNTVKLSRTGIGMIPSIKDSFNFAPPGQGAFALPSSTPPPSAPAAPVVPRATSPTIPVPQTPTLPPSKPAVPPPSAPLPQRPVAAAAAPAPVAPQPSSPVATAPVLPSVAQQTPAAPTSATPTQNAPLPKPAVPAPSAPLPQRSMAPVSSAPAQSVANIPTSKAAQPPKKSVFKKPFTAPAPLPKVQGGTASQQTQTAVTIPASAQVASEPAGVSLPKWTKIQLMQGEELQASREIRTNSFGIAFLASIPVLFSAVAVFLAKPAEPMIPYAIVGGIWLIAFMTGVIMASGKAKAFIALTSTRVILVLGSKKFELKK